MKLGGRVGIGIIGLMVYDGVGLDPVPLVWAVWGGTSGRSPERSGIGTGLGNARGFGFCFDRSVWTVSGRRPSAH